MSKESIPTNKIEDQTQDAKIAMLALKVAEIENRRQNAINQLTTNKEKKKYIKIKGGEYQRWPIEYVEAFKDINTQYRNAIKGLEENFSKEQIDTVLNSQKTDNFHTTINTPTIIESGIGKIDETSPLNKENTATEKEGEKFIEIEKNPGDYNEVLRLIKSQIENPKESTVMDTEEKLKQYPYLAEVIKNLYKDPEFENGTSVINKIFLENGEVKIEYMPKTKIEYAANKKSSEEERSKRKNQRIKKQETNRKDTQQRQEEVTQGIEKIVGKMDRVSYTGSEQKNIQEWTTEDEKVLSELLNVIEESKNKINEIDKKLEEIRNLNVNVDSIIEEEITDNKKELDKEIGEGNISEIVKKEVIEELNNKENKPRGKTILEKIRQKIKTKLLALMVATSFEVSASFKAPESELSLTYDKLRIENLDDWNNIKLNQDDINKFGNIEIINEANKELNVPYLIIDKEVGLAHLYQGGNLISSYEVGVGEKIGDEQTETIVKDGRVFWSEGNKKTGAGIYAINKENHFKNSPSYTLLNERGIETPTVLHETLNERKKLFKDGNKENNRMSNGCINFQAASIQDLAKKGLDKGVKIYVLPENPHNKFQLVDGELRFISNEEKVNKTIKPYEAKPIIIKAENANETGKEFLQTLSNYKTEIMQMYPTVSNDVYNQLAKIAYGIFGQESSFGTYGQARGQWGRLRDWAGTLLHKNVSAGVSQIRITSLDPKIKEKFNIQETQDLYDVEKSSIATMCLLLDIYTKNIPNSKKDKYLELVPLFYNSPEKFKEYTKNNKKIDSMYVKNVLTNANNVKVYLSE